MARHKFYNTAAWARAREAALRRDNYLCAEHLRRGVMVPATMVHHLRHYKDHPDEGLDIANLESLCNDCHNQAHPERGRREDPDRQVSPPSTVKVNIIKI